MQENKSKGFYKVPRFIAKELLSSKDSEKIHVCLWIVDNTNYQDSYLDLKKNQCYTSMATIAKDTGIELIKVKRVMKQLEKDGWIKYIFKSNSKKKASIIHVNFIDIDNATVPVDVSIQNVENAKVEGYIKNENVPVDSSFVPVGVPVGVPVQSIENTEVEGCIKNENVPVGVPSSRNISNLRMNECMNVYKQNLNLTPVMKDFIQEHVIDKIDIVLFEEIIARAKDDTSVKYKGSYIRKTILDLSEKGITDYIAYKTYNEMYNAKRKKQAKEEKSSAYKRSKTTSTGKNNATSGFKPTKMHYNAGNETFKQYEPKELESNLRSIDVERTKKIQEIQRKNGTLGNSVINLEEKRNI